MKFVIQKVINSSVEVDGKIVGKINKGFNILVGIHKNDTKEIADKMVKKTINLRIFEDDNGKMNLNIKDVSGEILVISQFTLLANMARGNRPSFIEAGIPEMSNEIYEYIVSEFKKNIAIVENGIFGADMKVNILNDGPVTIVLDSNNI